MCWWSSSFEANTLFDIEDLCLTLRKLKSATKWWTKDKLASLDTESSNLELAIESILAGPSKGILTKEQIAHLSHLNAKRHKILEHFHLT